MSVWTLSFRAWAHEGDVRRAVTGVNRAAWPPTAVVAGQRASAILHMQLRQLAEHSGAAPLTAKDWEHDDITNDTQQNSWKYVRRIASVSLCGIRIAPRREGILKQIDGNALVVGHSNTVPDAVKALSVHRTGFKLVMRTSTICSS